MVEIIKVIDKTVKFLHNANLIMKLETIQDTDLNLFAIL